MWTTLECSHEFILKWKKCYNTQDGCFLEASCWLGSITQSGLLLECNHEFVNVYIHRMVACWGEVVDLALLHRVVFCWSATMNLLMYIYIQDGCLLWGNGWLGSITQSGLLLECNHEFVYVYIHRMVACWGEVVDLALLHRVVFCWSATMNLLMYIYTGWLLVEGKWLTWLYYTEWSFVGVQPWIC